MELRIMKYYIAIVQAGSIAKASKEIHVTQPALSKQIADLEKRLGKKLFSRGYHGISLTKEGSILYERALEITALIDKTTEDVTNSDSTPSGTVHIGANRPPALRLLSRTAKDIHDKYPDIKFNIVNGNTQTLLESLNQGKVDFIIAGNPMRANFAYKHLPFTSNLGIIASRGSELYEYTSITKDDLLKIPLSIIESDFIKSEISGWLGQSMDALNIVSTHTLIRSAVKMSQEGLGYPLCLNTDVDVDIYNTLKFIPLKPWIETTTDLIWKKGKTFSRITELFLKTLEVKMQENYLYENT